MTASSTQRAAFGPADAEPAIDERIVTEAIDWYVRQASGLETQHDRRAFQHWYDAHADHARAWQRMQDVGGRVRNVHHRVGPAVGHATLSGAAQDGRPRRRVLKTLVWAGAAGTGLYVLGRRAEQGGLSSWLADARTRAGERRTLTLADGTRLLLNTATSVDIDFDAALRRVRLHDGEIMVTTARDAANRPFIVETVEGVLRPVGTKFTVRRDDATTLHGEPATRIGVSEGAVDVSAKDGLAPMRLVAGQQAAFTRTVVAQPQSLRESDLAWSEGMLVAERARLGDFIAELERYRPGRLRCDAVVADLRVTGTWPLSGGDPTDRILASLEQQLPVRQQRLTRYWVTLGPR